MVADSEIDLPLSGRCYCGASTISATTRPEKVVYCHCSDCRRSTGAPVAAYAAFVAEAVTFSPSEGRVASAAPGSSRHFCESCGSTLSGRYDYLPGQVYVPVGLFDQADVLEPEIHAHASSGVSWLHIEDDLPRMDQSARASLNSKSSN